MLGFYGAARSSGKALKVEIQMDMDDVLQEDGPSWVRQGAVPRSEKGHFGPPGLEPNRSTLPP